MAQSFTRFSPTARQARSVDKALTTYQVTFLFLGLPCPEEADGGKPCHCCRRWTNSWGASLDAGQTKILTPPTPKKESDLSINAMSAFGAGHHLACVHHSWGCHWPLHLHEEAL